MENVKTSNMENVRTNDMEDVRATKNILGVANEIGKQALYGTAEVGSQLTREGVPTAKCIIRTVGKGVHYTGELFIRGTITLNNYAKQAQSSSEVSSRLGRATDFKTLEAANALPSGVSNLEEYIAYLDEQLNY